MTENTQSAFANTPLKETPRRLKPTPLFSEGNGCHSKAKRRIPILLPISKHAFLFFLFGFRSNNLGVRSGTTPRSGLAALGKKEKFKDEQKKVGYPSRDSNDRRRTLCGGGGGSYSTTSKEGFPPPCNEGGGATNGDANAGANAHSGKAGVGTRLLVLVPHLCSSENHKRCGTNLGQMW